MRIDELQLLAFGPFTDCVIDLSGGQEGFHLVYGPNEAGKSSALRALRYLLYGIPARSNDNFLHPYSKMRIGATIRSGNGDVIKFVRRKGRNNTLREPDDMTMLEEALLQRFISGIDQDLFATMFGIGYEDLVRGGQDIIQGGGDVGRLVFSAGSGIANLLEIQNELQTESDYLFRPSGQKQKINEALIQLRQSRIELKSVQLKGQDWHLHDKRLLLALERKQKIQNELRNHQKRLNRLKRIQQALPLIAERKDLENDLKIYADAVLLPEDFPEKRRELVSKLATAQSQQDQSLKNIEICNNAISELIVSYELLVNGDDVEDIHLELGSQNKAIKDRVQLETRRSSLMAESSEILKNLDDSLTIEEVEKRRIKKIEAMKIRKLGAEYERIITRIEDARKKLPELTQKIDEIDKQLCGISAPRALDRLRQAMAEAEEYGIQEKQNRLEQYEIKSALKTIELEQNQLGLKEKSFEEIESLPLPLSETIRIFEENFDVNDRLLNHIKTEYKKVQGELLEVERHIEAKRLEQEVPTEEDLQKARELRDTGWNLIAGILGNESVSEEIVQGYLEGTPDSITLIEAFGANIRHADIISDRLRREAGRVAEKAMLLAKQTSHKDQLKQLEKDQEDAGSKRHQMTIEWTELWRPLGIEYRSPREMAQWANDFKLLVQKVKDLRSRRIKSEELQKYIDTHRVNLRNCLVKLESEKNYENDSLSILIKKSQSLIAAEEEILRKREQLLRDKKKLGDELQSAIVRLKSSEKDLNYWQEQWEQAVRPIGLNAGAQPEEAGLVMDELKNLFEKIKEADIIQKRIIGIDRDREEFARRVTCLVDVVARDLADRPASEAALELHHRLKQSREARTKKETLQKQLEQEKRRLNNAIRNSADLENQLKSMCEEACCEHIDQLPQAEQRSARHREIKSRLESNDNQLRRLSGGAALEDFIKDTAEMDPDGITGEIQALEEDIETFNFEKSELDQTIGSEKNELSKMDGSGKAAELAERIQIILAGIENNAQQYVRLKIAVKMLNMAFERYREKSQGPVLSRASELFNQITGGAFDCIRAEYDEKGQPVIVGIRSGNKEIVHVEGMSDGTADQLYLALRLAGLEIYSENNEPIPFIVDDILIKFDNGRAAATLKVLAKMSEKTQLIFFTHHYHLIQLANENIPSAMLFNYRL
jgi:uncharacterized protein YhaN